mmetsp:Transcript_47947/g.113006  ORF Transcript_47947/g.113006 Transcript_47947/m.113006 type:complete len:311 (+) Transcript_47947:103-1035(+)
MFLHRAFAALILLAPLALLPSTHAFAGPAPFARGVRLAPACSGGVLRGQGSTSVRPRPLLFGVRMSESGGWDDAEVRWEDPPVDTTARKATPEELKRQFLVAAAGANRGLAAAKEQRRALLDLVEALEGVQSEKSGGVAPNDDPELLGRWRLLFTSAFDVLSLGAIPLVLPGQIFQNVYERDGEGMLTVDNVVELSPATEPILSAMSFGSTLQLVVTARGVKQGTDQVGISFEKSRLQPLSLMGQDVSALFPPLDVPLELPQDVRTATDIMAQGSIRTTFLDEDMRIARGAAGNGLYSETDSNVFVLWRA